jgi:hypothetical protein
VGNFPGVFAATGSRDTSDESGPAALSRTAQSTKKRGDGTCTRTSSYFNARNGIACALPGVARLNGLTECHPDKQIRSWCLGL